MAMQASGERWIACRDQRRYTKAQSNSVSFPVHLCVGESHKVRVSATLAIYGRDARNTPTRLFSLLTNVFNPDLKYPCSNRLISWLVGTVTRGEKVSLKYVYSYE